MIAVNLVAEVQKLLAEGKLSQRKIALLTGVSRGSVGAIALGRRPDYEARPAEEDAFEEPLGPPVRCGGCGGWVYMPCRFCLAQKAKQESRRSKSSQTVAPPGERLQLELQPEHRARYEEVRRRRCEGCESVKV